MKWDIQKPLYKVVRIKKSLQAKCLKRIILLCGSLENDFNMIYYIIVDVRDNFLCQVLNDVIHT